MKDPNFDIAFSIAGFNIYWYAILLALGIAVAVMIADRRARGREVPKDIALDLCILGVPSIREFALPIIVGILSGVYSANMINGYVWAFLEEKRRGRGKKAKA